MRINILTLFPEWFASPLDTALLGKAREAGLVEFDILNPRDRTEDRHHIVDDRPYGGGPGMVMMLEPLVKTLRELETERGGAGRIIMLAAAGKPLTQSLARELAREETLTLVCGRYEGIDARLMDILPVEQVSVGEAVLNGGEAAAMMLVEAATRLIPGFMGKEESGDDESFSAGLLEYPHFTRPEVFEDVPVPDVLRSGDHGRIAKWRREQSLRTTLRVRPDMLDGAPLTSDDMEYLRGNGGGRWTAPPWPQPPLCAGALSRFPWRSQNRRNLFDKPRRSRYSTVFSHIWTGEFHGCNALEGSADHSGNAGPPLDGRARRRLQPGSRRSVQPRPYGFRCAGSH